MNGKRESALFLVTLLITKGMYKLTFFDPPPHPVDFNPSINLKQFYASVLTQAAIAHSNKTIANFSK